MFQNDCGGVRICLNKSEDTYVLKNRIHDHTGPDFVQTVLFLEHAPSLGLSREEHSIPVYILDNFSYNNEMAYESFSDRKISFENRCDFCEQKGASVDCSKCRKAKYCNFKCLESASARHKNFCEYVRQTFIEHLILDDTYQILPSNTLLQNRMKKMTLDDYLGREFLVKVTAGRDHFGMNSQDLVSDEDEKLFVYDEYRFVSGITCNSKLFTLVRLFGKLTAEKIFSKRLYLFAKITKRDKTRIEVRTDQFVHNLDW